MRRHITSKTVTEMDICVRSSWPFVLLLVYGCVISIFIQFLGHHLSFCLPRDQRRNAARVVLSRLLFRFFISNRYPVPFSYWISRRRSPANRLHKVTTTLHELDNLLHRLPMLVAIRFFIFKHRLQFDIAVMSISENLSFLGVYGSHRAPYKLSKSLPFDVSHTLLASNIPLEWMFVSYNQ